MKAEIHQESLFHA